MTAKQFVSKFPDCDVVHSLTLMDLACPECGQRESLKIQVNTVMNILDTGTDDHGDVEWDEDSFAQCGDCYHEGNVSDFRITGLDALITSTLATRSPA